MTGVSPAIARPMVVLPEPDSPTRPSDLPRRDVEVDAVDRAERLAPEPPRVLDLEAARRDDGLRSALAGWRACGRSTSSTRGTAASSFFVYSCCGAANSSPHGRRLDDLALVHHGDAVGEVGDDAHVVGDQHDRGAELVAAATQQVEDLGLHRHVERRRRLVGDEHRGVERERHRDHDALLLPARELVRVVVDPQLGLGDADLPQHLDRVGHRLLLRVLAVRAQPLRELPADREHRVQRRRRLLEDHRALGAADLAQPLARSPITTSSPCSTTAPRDLGGLGQQAEDRAGGDRLARAGLADDREHLAGGDLEVDTVARP